MGEMENKMANDQAAAIAAAKPVRPHVKTTKNGPGTVAVSGAPNDGAQEDEATPGAKRKRSCAANGEKPSRAKPNKTAAATTESQ